MYKLFETVRKSVPAGPKEKSQVGLAKIIS